MTDWEPSKDGDWIDIQHNTFMNWVNQQLKSRELEIKSLATDLADGINLINLIEVAAGGQKTVGKYNKQIKIQTHKLENTQIALNFLVREGVKIVNIGNEDIVNGNLKLILGLIWTLILRYHITKGQDGRSAKNDLLRWVRSKIPEYNIKNFTTDWNDGKAICALTNAVGPGLCPGHRDLKGQPIENAKKGIDLAHKRLDIPPVLGPDDMVNKNVDELSVMTYIQYFRNACMNEAPIPTAEGPGLIAGKVGEPAHYTIFRNNADGDITTEVVGPNGPAKTEMVDNNDGTYSVTYYPKESGKFTAFVKLEGENIPNSPYFPLITADINLVKAYGPGLIGGKVGKPGLFTVEPNGHNGVLDIKIKGPKGPVPVKFEKNPQGNYDCRYDPTVSGIHDVDITMDGEEIPENPWHPLIEADVSKIRAHGPGLIRGKVGVPAKFVVEPNGNDGNLTITVNSPKGPVPIKFEKNASDNYDCVYDPEVSGDYVVDIKMNGEDIPENQFHPIIDPDVSKIRAHGPGLVRGKVGVPAKFVVEPNGNDGNLTITVNSPKGPVPIKFEKNPEGNYDCVYDPEVSGNYVVDIKMNDQDIPENKFHPIIDIDASRIRAHGPGLVRGKVGSPAKFVVEPNGNDGNLTITVNSPKGPVPIKFQKNASDNYDCVYDPEVSGDYVVDIKMDGQDIPENQFHPIIDLDISRIRAHGPGLVRGKVGSPAKFVVEPNGNEGDLTITVNSPKGPVPVKFEKNPAGNYDCVYDPEVSGDYVVDIKMNDQDIPENKFHPIIDLDLNRIRAHGPGLVRGKVGNPAKFVVEPNGNDGNLTIAVNSPKGPVPVKFQKNPEGNYDCVYDPEVSGDYVVDIKMDGQDIPENKFHPKIDPDVTRVRAYGPGLEEGMVNEPAPFKVDVYGQNGELKIVVEGPEGPIPCTAVRREDGDYDCQYVPQVPGEYLIDIKMDDQDVPDSPFYVVINDDFRNVRCAGPGIEGGFAGIPTDFTVFPNGHVGKLKVWIQGPEDPAVCVVTKNEDGTYLVEYTPEVPGEYYINVTMDDRHVPGSPFLIIVMPKKRSGPSLGGEGKIRVFYTSTSAMEKVKKNQKKLQDVLEKRGVNKRPDFEPWISLDVGMEKSFRDMIFAKAGRREPPLMFIDDEPTPECDELFKMDDEGTFDELLKYMPKFDK